MFFSPTRFALIVSLISHVGEELWPPTTKCHFHPLFLSINRTSLNAIHVLRSAAPIAIRLLTTACHCATRSHHARRCTFNQVGPIHIAVAGSNNWARGRRMTLASQGVGFPHVYRKNTLAEPCNFPEIHNHRGSTGDFHFLPAHGMENNYTHPGLLCILVLLALYTATNFLHTHSTIPVTYGVGKKTAFHT